MKKYFVPALLLTVLYSCSTGSVPVQRKELPELTDANATPGLPFRTGYVNLQTAGRTETFLAVSLPDTNEDSAVINLVNTYKPFAASMLTEWARQSGKGVLIDLRLANSDMEHRADYSVEYGSAVYIPVVILWDNASSARAATFMNMMHSTSIIKVNRLASNPAGIGGTRNCFSSDVPSFDHP